MGRLAGSASAEIAAPMSVVYATVSDIAGYVAWQPGLDTATVLESDRWGRQALVRIEMTRGGSRISSELRFSYERDAWVRCAETRENSPACGGSRECVGGVVLATYAIDLDLGRIAGLMLGRR